MEESAVPQKKRFSGLAFLEIGLFEVVFVVVVLLLLFGTLNYFNILSVSSVFPNQFGWLPRQQTKVVINPSPTPSNFTSSEFQYDTKKAETLLTEYIKSTIKPDLLPQKIEVKRNTDEKLDKIPYKFTSSFLSKNVAVSANFYYKINTSIPNAFVIFIKPENVNQATITASLTNSFLPSSFIRPYTVSSCKTEDYISYCENFQSLTDGKRGYGAFKTSASLTLINCFIPKESEYFSLESCINL